MASADAETTEKKMEGTIEAAQELHQDPQSHVNPDIVEQKVVDENKPVRLHTNSTPTPRPKRRPMLPKGCVSHNLRILFGTIMLTAVTSSDCRLISIIPTNPRVLL